MGRAPAVRRRVCKAWVVEPVRHCRDWPSPEMGRPVMVGSAAMRGLRAAAGRWGGQLSTVVVLLGLCAAGVAPQNSVWCRGSAGHTALEPAWSTCCAPADGVGSCATWSAPLDSGADPAVREPSVIRCADVWLGVPGAVSQSRSSLQPPLHAIAAPGAGLSACSGPLRSTGSSVPPPCAWQVRELIRTTVLTI